MKCNICYNNWSGIIVPYIIDCAHTFCIECLNKIEKCSICKTPITMRNKNYQLIEIIDSFNNVILEDKELIS